MTESKRACPSCAALGRPVSIATVHHLCTTDPKPDWDRAWFCESATCEVVYFDAHDACVAKQDVRVVVFQKETDDTRPVCYCFGHTVADVVDASGTDGSNRIVDEITGACRRGLDRCEESNPQGRCCLGNVRGLVRGTAAPDCCERGSKAGGS